MLKVDDLLADRDQQAYLADKTAQGWRLLGCVFITDSHTNILTGQTVTLKVFRHIWEVPEPRQVNRINLRECDGSRIVTAGSPARDQPG